MLEGLALNWTEVGAKGIVVLTVLLILLGRLIPSKRLDDQRADYERQLRDLRQDKDAQIVLWQATAQTAQAQVSELMEHGRMSVGILESFDRRAEGGEGT